MSNNTCMTNDNIQNFNYNQYLSNISLSNSTNTSIDSNPNLSQNQIPNPTPSNSSTPLYETNNNSIMPNVNNMNYIEDEDDLDDDLDDNDTENFSLVTYEAIVEVIQAFFVESKYL